MPSNGALAIGKESSGVSEFDLHERADSHRGGLPKMGGLPVNQSFLNTSKRYDHLNRLVAIESKRPSGAAGAATRAEFFYDYLGRCVLRKYYTNSGGENKWTVDASDSVIFTYDLDWNLLVERGLDGIQEGEYLHGFQKDDILRAELVTHPSKYSGESEQVYPLMDGSLSTVALVDSSGAVLERFKYDVFGNMMAPIMRDYRFLYMGREHLAKFDLNDHRNRYYSPKMGRWLSRDPLLLQDGLNVYTAFNSNPVNRLDPLGLANWVFKGYGIGPVIYSGNYLPSGVNGDYSHRYSTTGFSNGRSNLVSVPVEIYTMAIPTANANLSVGEGVQLTLAPSSGLVTKSGTSKNSTATNHSQHFVTAAYEMAFEKVGDRYAVQIAYGHGYQYGVGVTFTYSNVQTGLGAQITFTSSHWHLDPVRNFYINMEDISCQ